MALWTSDPDEVWAYCETGDDDRKVPLPLWCAAHICSYCRYLIPDNPAECCWRCTWDITDEQDTEYQKLLIAFEAEVLATLTPEGASPA